MTGMRDRFSHGRMRSWEHGDRMATARLTLGHFPGPCCHDPALYRHLGRRRGSTRRIDGKRPLYTRIYRRYPHFVAPSWSRHGTTVRRPRAQPAFGIAHQCQIAWPERCNQPNYICFVCNTLAPKCHAFARKCCFRTFPLCYDRLTSTECPPRTVEGAKPISQEAERGSRARRQVDARESTKANEARAQKMALDGTQVTDNHRGTQRNAMHTHLLYRHSRKVKTEENKKHPRAQGTSERSDRPKRKTYKGSGRGSWPDPS